MSLTLRDAQHLSWKTFKKFESKGENLNINGIIIELSKIVDDLEKSSDLSDPSKKDEFSKQVSKLIYYTFVLSEANSIDLEESYLKSMDEIIMNFVF